MTQITDITDVDSATSGQVARYATFSVTNTPETIFLPFVDNFDEEGQYKTYSTLAPIEIAVLIGDASILLSYALPFIRYGDPNASELDPSIIYPEIILTSPQLDAFVELRSKRIYDRLTTSDLILLTSYWNLGRVCTTSGYMKQIVFPNGGYTKYTDDPSKGIYIFKSYYKYAFEQFVQSFKKLQLTAQEKNLIGKSRFIPGY
jgi:hypothetical protein